MPLWHPWAIWYIQDSGQQHWQNGKDASVRVQAARSNLLRMIVFSWTDYHPVLLKWGWLVGALSPVSHKVWHQGSTQTAIHLQVIHSASQYPTSLFFFSFSNHSSNSIHTVGTQNQKNNNTCWGNLVENTKTWLVSVKCAFGKTCLLRSPQYERSTAFKIYGSLLFAHRHVLKRKLALYLTKYPDMNLPFTKCHNCKTAYK